MKQQVAVSTSNAPGAIGPYSQAIQFGELLFCSGQCPLDPTSGHLVGKDVTEQTHRAIENLRGVLQAAGSSLGHVLKTTVFLTTMDDFAAINAAYGEYFQDPAPARSTVAVRELPRKSLVEIEAVAYVVGS